MLETEGLKGGVQNNVVIIVEVVVIADEQREYDEANPTVGVGMRDQGGDAWRGVGGLLKWTEAKRWKAREAGNICGAKGGGRRSERKHSRHQEAPRVISGCGSNRDWLLVYRSVRRHWPRQVRKMSNKTVHNGISKVKMVKQDYFTLFSKF
jgi:hypothetical protein